MPEATLKRLKTHDQVYLTMERQKEIRKIEQLQQELQFIGVEKPKQHIVFVDNEQDAEKFDAAEFFDTDPSLVSRFYNRPRREDLEKNDFVEPPEATKSKKKRYRELESRVKRKSALDAMLNVIDTQKKMMDKAPKKVIKDAKTGKQVVKWETVRKR